jgi:hypothetical protein
MANPTADMMTCRCSEGGSTDHTNRCSGEFYVGTRKCQFKIPHPGDFLNGTFEEIQTGIDTFCLLSSVLL